MLPGLEWLGDRPNKRPPVVSGGGFELTMRGSRLLAVIAAAVGCAALGLASVAGNASALPPGDAVRNEIARSRPQGDIPVYAVVREHGTVNIVRTMTTRAEADALTRRLQAMPGVLAAGIDGEVHIAAE